MRKRIFILFLLLMVIRELGYFNLDYYRSNFNWSINSHWNTNSSTIITESPQRVFSTGNQQSFEIPVRVEYRGKVLYTEPSSGITAVVTITDLNHGFLWAPLYKSSNISAGAYVSLEGADNGLYWDGSRVDMLQVSGDFSFSGNIFIRGICSHRTAVGIVSNEIVKGFVKNTKQYLARHRLGL